MTEQGWVGKRPTGNNSHFDSADAWNVRVSRSLYGARAFLADKSGWLTGVTYQKIWLPGVNTASCYRVTGWHVEHVGVVSERPGKQWHSEFTGEISDMGVPVTDRVFDGWGWKLESGETGITRHEPRPVYGNADSADHDLAECGCGFHSYLRGSLDYSHDSRAINGIVRNFGRIRRCKRGVRAQMAEIVALYVPTEAPEITPKPANHEPLTEGIRRAGKVIHPDILEAVSARYPAVPIYRDLDEMLTLHPTEEPS